MAKFCNLTPNSIFLPTSSQDWPRSALWFHKLNEVCIVSVVLQRILEFQLKYGQIPISMTKIRKRFRLRYQGHPFKSHYNAKSAGTLASTAGPQKSSQTNGTPKTETTGKRDVQCEVSLRRDQRIKTPYC